LNLKKSLACFLDLSAKNKKPKNIAKGSIMKGKKPQQILKSNSGKYIQQHQMDMGDS